MRDKIAKERKFFYISFKENRRGWIRVVEAVIALLLVSGVILFMINKGYIGKSDASPKVYDDQIEILRSIQLDQNLRLSVVKATWEDPLINQTSWDADKFPQDVRQKIEEKTPAYMICVAKLCELDKVCVLKDSETPDSSKEVYSQAVAISAEKDIYKPKQLKLFCWRE